MYSELEKRHRLDLYTSATASEVFNSQTGEGDPEVLQSFRKSVLDKALLVLSYDKRNGPARRVARWALRDDLRDPDLSSLSSVWRQAGFETYHLIFNP